MGERSSLDYVGIQAAPCICFILAVLELTFCEATADLCNLQGVREAIVEDISLASRRHLGYSAQATELRGVKNPVAIPLVGIARIVTIGMKEPIRPMLTLGQGEYRREHNAACHRRPAD